MLKPKNSNMLLELARKRILTRQLLRDRNIMARLVMRQSRNMKGQITW